MLVNPFTILRCTASDEQIDLDPKDIAFMVEESCTCVPEKYGAYLIPLDLFERYSELENAYVMPSDCKPGSFVLISSEDEPNTIRLLGTADIPDRTLFTTGQCNSNCIMCPYTEKFRHMTPHEELQILHRFVELMDPYAEYLCITGGEPTLLKAGFLQLLHHVKNHFQNAMVHILTNGRTFYYNDFLQEYLKVRPYGTLLGIPLHASSADIHDYISQSKGSFEETIRGIDNLYLAGEHVEVRIVTSAINNDDLPKLAQLIARRYPQIYHVCFMGLEMMGNSMINRSKVWISYDDLWPNLKEAIDILLSCGIPVQLYNYPLCKIESKYHSMYRRSITPSKVEYLDVCNECSRMLECGGFFKTTKIMPGINAIPYKG